MKKTLSLIIFFVFFILASISPIFGAIPIEGNVFDLSVSVEKPVSGEGLMSSQKVSIDFSQPKTIYYNKKIPITIDYEKGIYSVEGREYSIIIDDDWEKIKQSITGVLSYEYLSYPRFEAYIDSAYYAGREAVLQDYLTKLNVRFAEMETQTGWSSEKFYGKKLDVYIYNGGSSCAAGWAIPGEAHIGLHTLFPDPNWCKFPYYDGGIPLFNNPGELGDYWIYWGAGLHENLHAINPIPIYDRAWLSEGWSQYYEFNILADSQFLDINQETADYYIENANFTAMFGNFQEYVSNNYRDKYDQEIQESAGYDITAWMFSMMRDNHGLDWNQFYQIMEDNPETMNRAWELKTFSDYYMDMYVIDLFGRASGLTFPQTQAIWRYDSPSGPGWGVRNWELLDWYADLRVPYLNFSDTNGNIFYMGENVTINTNVSNTGQVDLQGVTVKIYEGANLLKEQIININAGAIVPISTNFYSPTASSYNIKVIADENDIKIESNDSNNENTKVLSFQPATCGDVNNDGVHNVLDVVSMIGVAFRNQPQTEPLWVWNVNGVGGPNGPIDIVDVVKIINVAFRNANPETELTCSQPAPNAQASTTITLQKINKGFSASASLDRNVAGMQFDLSYDSSKVKISGVKTATRTSGMTITNTQISAGKNKIAIYSDNGEKFIKSGSGTLFTVQATGSDFSSLKLIPVVVDYKTSNAFSNVKVNYKFKTTTIT